MTGLVCLALGFLGAVALNWLVSSWLGEDSKPPGKVDNPFLTVPRGQNLGDVVRDFLSLVAGGGPTRKRRR
jgi:hypothetical protein